MKKSFRKFVTLVGLFVPCVALLMGAFGPSLRAATFSDDNWIGMGGFPGAEGWVGSSAVDASGNLYIGGGFRIAGDVLVNGIAKWDGTNWSALGSGQSVYAMTASGHDVFVAGWFTAATGGVGNSIARWNGTNWSALGSGILGSAGDPYVPALAASGSDLYVGGSFATAGGNPATNIARWNGSSWSALGSGMDNTVSALSVSGSDVYAGGDFTNAGGVAASRIARWNGSSWSALGSGVNGTVTKLAVHGNDLYVAGDFSTAGGITVTNMAKWDGSSWSAFPSPIYGVNEPILWGTVKGLVTSGSDLYAAGEVLIDLEGGWVTTFRTYVVKWNGSNWIPLEPGISWAWDSYDIARINALAVSGTNVYAGGEFRQAGNSTAHCIARWNGGNWSALAPTFCSLSAMTVSGRDLYGAGLFPAPGGTPSNHVAKWNGNGWSPLSSGVGGVNALAVSGSDLYAGGSFTSAGGTPANGIAKWDGTNWSALGAGIDGGFATVSSLAVLNRDLYAGGSFSSAGGIPANGIAKWNGTNWSALSSGVAGGTFGGVYATVSALAVLGSNLYAGGNFTTAGGNPANYIAKWDGTSWSAVGSGLGARVSTLAVMGNELYAGAGGSAVKWDGTNWSGLWGMEADYWSRGGEHRSTPYVFALTVSGGSLYAGGYFNYAGEESANFIARWNGNKWSALGSGMDYGVGLLAATDTELFAAGDFWTAGGKSSPYLARARIGVAAQGVSAASSAATIRFSGVTGYPHDVQRATNLTPPVVWATVNSTPLYPAADGSFTFTDTNAVHGTAFYRATAIGFGPAECPRLGLQQPAGTNLAYGESVSLGVMAVGSSVTKTFTITNSGAGWLIINDVSTYYGDSEFVVDTTGMLNAVAAGGSTTFTVKFSPASAGIHWEELDVFIDSTECYDPNEGWFPIYLNGTGL